MKPWLVADCVGSNCWFVGSVGGGAVGKLCWLFKFKFDKLLATRLTCGGCCCWFWINCNWFEFKSRFGCVLKSNEN